MFKQSSAEDEIYRAMETVLVKNQTEVRHGFDKLAKAADFLSTAAEIFDQAGMLQESEEILEILKNLSQDYQ
jgi:soluble cytochrome b562